MSYDARDQPKEQIIDYATKMHKRAQKAEGLTMHLLFTAQW